MRRFAFVVLAALCAPVATAHDASAHSAAGHAASSTAAPDQATKGPADDVFVRGCWVRNMPANLPSAAYFVIVNKRMFSIEVTGVSSPAYGSAMMHATEHTGGMARMVAADRVKVSGRDGFAFRPGGYHVMLEKSVQPRTVGEHVPLHFTLSDGHSLQADCVVKPAGAVGP
ncbi:MAG: copper chaperone PCu(A)C [Burkholderiaceae bacterium]|nr:copper chaperone PCu(A)C [Burkholderiaceae bacterium]